MKRRRFPFAGAAILFIAAIGVITSIFVWLNEIMMLPEWHIPIVTLLSFLLAIEVPRLIGPSDFETPLSWYAKASRRDKIVTVIGFILSSIVAWPVGYSVSTAGWIRVGFAILGGAIYVFICLVAGTPELRSAMVPSRRKSHIEHE